ncbi:unnamed protein product, partial [Symbiodinium sp. CCMP2456]
SLELECDANRTPNAEISCLRRFLCWAGFFVPVCCEVCLHAKQGFNKSEILREDGLLPPQLDEFLTFAELVCRVCLAQVLMFMVWQFGRALAHNKVCQLLSSCQHSTPSRLLPALALALFTFAIGVWGCNVGDEGLPAWALSYSHVCDIFCHGIVASALMGLGFDVVRAAREGWLLNLFKQFVFCQDTVEAHGVSGREGETEFGQFLTLSFHSTQSASEAHAGHKSLCDILRICFMWTSFLFMLWAYTLSVYFPGLAPEWIGTFVDFVGRFCWAGISFWLVSCALSMRDTARCHRREANPGQSGDLPTARPDAEDTAEVGVTAGGRPLLTTALASTCQGAASNDMLTPAR